MTEINKGYFNEGHIRDIMTDAGTPIPDGQLVDLHDPTIQRQVARLSALRALARYWELGETPVTVFRRRVPTKNGTEEICWVIDLRDPAEEAKLKGFYYDLAAMEQKPDTGKNIIFIDNFCKSL